MREAEEEENLVWYAVRTFLEGAYVCARDSNGLE